MPSPAVKAVPTPTLSLLAATTLLFLSPTPQSPAATSPPPTQIHEPIPTPAPTPVPTGTQQLLFAFDEDNDLAPTGFSGGSGQDAEGFWDFTGATSGGFTATTAGGQTGGGLVGRDISASAAIACTLSPSGIAATTSAHATAPPAATADFIQSSVNFSMTMTIAQPSEFFIVRTGTVGTANLSPITGSIIGNQLTAGSYRLNLGNSAGFSGPGQTISRAGTFDLVLGSCLADWNNDAAINGNDISNYITAWLASIIKGNLIADVNNDAVVNSGDLTSFILTWHAALAGDCG